MVSLYLSTELIERIDVLKENFARSTWIENKLLKIINEG
jgi:hypothetical protein